MGSFAGVLVVRIPRKKSIVFPASSCPHCRQKIAWYDNLPVIGFILLGGKCRFCRKNISWFYPAIELLAALIFLAVYLKFGFQPVGFIFAIFSFFLLVLSLIDYDHQILPDALNLPLIFLGLVVSPLNYFLGETYGRRLLFSVLGILSGGGIIYLVGIVGEKILKKEAIGGGDLKLLAAIGSFLGPWGVFWTLLLGSLLGSLVGGGLMLAKRRNYGQTLPFGPFLSLGALGTVFFREWLKKIFS